LIPAHAYLIVRHYLGPEIIVAENNRVCFWFLNLSNIRLF